VSLSRSGERVGCEAPEVLSDVTGPNPGRVKRVVGFLFNSIDYVAIILIMSKKKPSFQVLSYYIFESNIIGIDID
jgi:hypothetical protein